MWRKKAALILVVTLASVLFAPGCATLTKRSRQRVPVTSSPMGATVTVDGVRQGVTPCELKLPRKEKVRVIRIESPGYDPMEIRMRRSVSTPHALSNVLLGSLVGLITAIAIYANNDEQNAGVLVVTCGSAGIGAFFLIDFATGAAYSFKPTDLVVTLTKSEGPPRVDTMFIDADDLRNIKWIRVRQD